MADDHMADDDDQLIEDILLRRQAGKFVGRSGQLALFRDNFNLPANDRYFVFNVYGEGGVGKTTLIDRWRAIAREQGAVEARIDEEVYGVPEAMAALADQLGGSAMTEFRARYADLLRVREQIVLDPQAPPASGRVLRTGVKVVLHASKAIPGAGPIIDFLDPDLAADAVDQVRVFLTRKLRENPKVELLLNPVQKLTPAFAAGVRELRQPVALFIDSFEQTGTFLERWLLDLTGQLSARAVTVVAGRKPLDANLWAGRLSLISLVPLTPFTDAEARQFLIAEGITDDRTADVILGLSGGLPLLIETLAKNRPANPAEVGDPTGTAVERFLKWEPDAARKQAALAGALPRHIDEDLLAGATGSADAADVFGWLISQPFVSVQSGRYRYHDVVRPQMVRLLRQRSSQAWQASHRRLADQQRSRLASLGPESGWSDSARLVHRTEEAYHRLCARDLTLAAALGEAVQAAKAGLSAARRWAEMLADAGRDLDDREIHTWGATLLASIGEQAEDSLDFLTALLRFTSLDAVSGAQILLERARVHYLAERDELAIQDCTSAIERDADCIEAYSIRGAALASLGRYGSALEDFAKALSASPGDTWAVTRRGETLRLMERYDEALADFGRAIELRPTSDWAIAERGETFRLMERYDEALADFGRAIALNPAYVGALVRRSQTYRSMKRYAEALADLDRTMELRPNSGWATIQHGETLRLMGHYDEALADLGRAIALNPDSVWAITERAATLRAQERFDEATADFDRAIALSPTSDWALTERGETLRAMGRYADALADFDRAIALNPDSGWALTERGATFQAMRRYDEALADLDRAIALNPTYLWALIKRGQTFRLRKRYDEAIADLTEAIALDPTSDSAIVERGDTFLRMGRYDEALGDLNRAVELRPTSSRALTERADTLRLMGRYDEALADLNRAIELNPADAWPIGTRGQTLRSMKRYDEALIDLNRAIDLQPGYGWVIAERGDTFRLQKRYDDALTDLERAIEMDPAEASNYAYRGFIYRDLARSLEARADFDRVHDLCPECDLAEFEVR
jgi:tetratricopeptide (TPR) repeat protein